MDLRALGVVALSLMCTVFFDDFCLFSEPALERSSDLATRSLFDLLGWAYDTSGEKIFVPERSAGIKSLFLF